MLLLVATKIIENCVKNDILQNSFHCRTARMGDIIIYGGMEHIPISNYWDKSTL